MDSIILFGTISANFYIYLQYFSLTQNSNYPTKKRNRNNKDIHNGDCILTKKLFYHQNKKKKKILK